MQGLSERIDRIKLRLADFGKKIPLKYQQKKLRAKPNHKLQK
jgi:hypothetical protein